MTSTVRWSVTISLALAGVLCVAWCATPTSPSAPGEGEAAAVLPARPVAARSEDVALTPELEAAGVTESDLRGPHDPPVDAFHPDARPDDPALPALGGRAIMHLASEPPSLNFATDNSSVIRWIYRDVHAALVQFSPVTWDDELDLARSYDVEDTLILKGGRSADNGNIVFGCVAQDGDSYVVTSGSRHNAIERRVVAKSDVQSLERGTVFTFTLRDDALWHDGHAFDEQDVVFSMSIYANPHVDCEKGRYKFNDVVKTEVLGPGVVRFFWKEQYFGTLGSFGFDFPILPRHLYDLSDPDNPDYAPEATPEQRGTYVNENPRNDQWVGLGPYRLTTWERGHYLEARKFDGYWEQDPAVAGYLDTIRWQVVSDDNSAFEALKNQDLDIFYRVKSEDFFGQATQSEVFTRNHYKAFTYAGNLGYLVWNLRRPQFEDVRVRRALAHAFDVRKWIDTNYEGYALWATGSQFWFGPAYDADVTGYPYDPETAEDLLAEAGWYDRDGNGIVDKDGQDLVIEALMPTGNKASEKFLQALMDAFGRVGVRVVIQQYEWATFLDKLYTRDFDAANLAWTLTSPESDPKQIWHGDEAPKTRSSNHSGLVDERVDELIDTIRRELDDETRWALQHELHARIYELQPYLFGWNVPRKLAFNKKLRGVKLYKFEPGFHMRDIYYEEGTPGTRPLGPSR